MPNLDDAVADDMADAPMTGPTADDPAASDHSSSPRTSAYARKAVLASAIGYAMDGFDLLILGFALSAIAVDLHLGTTQAGSLATVTLVGAVLGGVVFGILADLFGRAKILTYSVIFFAVFTGLTAISTNFAEIATFRFLAGIGIGGEYGIGMTLAAEAWPAAKRTRATSLVGLGWQAGVLAAALLSAPVLTAWGWRGLFALGAFPALIAVALRARLREPEQFAQTRAERGRGVPLKLLVADSATVRTTVGILVLTSVQNFGYYGIMTWLPTYLSTHFGYSLTKSSGWTAVTVVGMGGGIFLFGQLADRIGRRRTFWIFQFGAAVSVLCYSQLSAPLALLIGGAVMGAFANGMIGGYGALIADRYPTVVRSTAQNVLFNVGRAVGGLAPVVVALIATRYGFAVAIGLLSVIYVLDMVAMLLIPDNRAVRLS